MTGLELDLTATYGAFNLSVSLHTQLGGVTALFGPSGSGKTSILAAIAGFRPAIGKVVVEDRGESTRVEWTSSWEQNDEAIQEFCHPIYMALLNDMKASLEA